MKNILFGFFIGIIGFFIGGCSILPYQSDFSDGVHEVSGEVANAIKNRKFANELNGIANTNNISQYK